MGVKLQSSSGGSVEIAAPVTASNYTLTAPAVTASLSVDGPAFSAYATGQTISTAVATKLLFDTERFDTNSCYDTSLCRFTPNIAGYYEVDISVTFSGSLALFSIISLYKNGAAYVTINNQRSNANFNGVTLSAPVYMNGTTDYLEVYGYESIAASTPGGSVNSSFSAVLTRSA